MKKIILILTGVAIACLFLWPKTQTGTNSVIGVADYKKALYMIDGRPTAITYFGNDVRHDLDDDGRPDVAFIGTVSPGGSGTFYYALAALNRPAGKKGQDNWIASDGVLLGDRIAPQATNIDENNGRKNVIVFNYADRKPNEPMTAKPSVGKSIWLKLNPQTMRFGEVAQNFEGESR